MILYKDRCRELAKEIEEVKCKLAIFPNYDELSINDIPFYMFRKRKQFLKDSDLYYNLSKKLRLLESELQNLSRDLNPEEFRKSVRDRKIVLTEEDKTVVINYSDFNSFTDLCLVHKCNFMPFNNEIKSALYSGGKSYRNFNINGVSYSYTHHEQRNTVHFAVNGEVSSHDMGNWDSRRYAIIIPFECLWDNLVSACSCDSFVRDKASLNEKCYILCPKDDEEEVRKNNNLVNVIPYIGNNVRGFANAVISFLGYKCERISNHGWIGNDQYLYNALMKKHNLSMSEHMDTCDYSYDKIRNFYHHILEIYARLLGEDVIIDESTFQSMINEEYGNVYYDLRFFISGMLEECGHYFKDFETGRDKTINFLLDFMKALLNINPNIQFELNYESLKLKYFGDYYRIEKSLINDILNSLFASLIKNKKDNNKEIIEDSKIKLG